MSDQDRYNSNQQQPHSNSASILNGGDNSTPSAFWRNPAFSSSNNVPRMRPPMESPPQPPSQPLGREDMFRRHEPPVSSSSTVNMAPRIPSSYSIPMSQAAHPPPPPPTLPRPSPLPGYEQQQQPLPPLSSSSPSPSSSHALQQHTSPPQQPTRNSSPNASSGRRTRITRACKFYICMITYSSNSLTL